jgi:hypothetical protein
MGWLFRRFEVQFFAIVGSVSGLELTADGC